MDANPRQLPITIGVFDSGFGGLTVLRELLPLIPGAHYLYLGDTARLPYGSKSQTTIARYAAESARFLAVPWRRTPRHRLQHRLCPRPRRDPRRRRHPRHRRHLGPSSAPRSSAIPTPTSSSSPPPPPSNRDAYHAYCAGARPPRHRESLPPARASRRRRLDRSLRHPQVLRIYLREALGDGTPNAVLLGCTHYPLIAPAIRVRLARTRLARIEVIDSARATAFCRSAMRSKSSHRAQRPPATFQLLRHRLHRKIRPPRQPVPRPAHPPRRPPRPRRLVYNRFAT